MVDFVLLDHSMGLHNFEKASEMLEGALKLAKRAAKMRCRSLADCEIHGAK
jgi:hypothetical protein